MDKMCIVYITASNGEEAERIAEALVERRLAACVNIYNNVTSVYRWEGKTERAVEAVLFVKTRRSLFLKIKEAVKTMHSYSCPCVIEFPVGAVSKEYLKWVFSETKR